MPYLIQNDQNIMYVSLAGNLWEFYKDKDIKPYSTKL